MLCWLSAVISPSFVPPALTRILVWGRPPTGPNICGRVKASFTGRPTCFAASALMSTCDHAEPLQPNAPPTNFVSTRTFSFGSWNAVASLLRTANTHWEAS